METYLQGFHEDEQFSTNLLLSNVNEVMKDQLEGLESIKVEQNDSWGDETVGSQHTVGKEDFQQIMFDWQQHLGSLQSTENEDLGIGFDTNLDILNAYSSSDLFGELESPILSKALKYPGQKYAVNIQPLSKSLAHTVSKDSFLENLGSGIESLESTQKIPGLTKTEPNLIRKVTLKNGEKEILGKNIIGLHCLNELKENPDGNCQVTSTVINGKRYKIIIKPKSLKVKKLSDEKIRKTLIRKLMQCHLVTKTEPKEDEITSEMCNGNYDVPILNSDLLPSWDFASLDLEGNSQGSFAGEETVNETETEPVKKVPPLKIKIPKIKKHPKRPEISAKSDEEIDVESVGGKIVEGQSLSTLLKNFEKEVAKLEKKNGEAAGNSDTADGEKNDNKLPSVTSESIKNSLPKEMIERIEALKRKKDCRIPIIQAMPTKKAMKSGTRMQDAVATMNRNKLLKIVSGGDSVQMDHDYCSTFTKNNATSKQSKKQICAERNLAEKNPKKDSGMESGDVSDASESPNVGDSLQNLQCLRQVNNKVLEEHRRVGDHSSVTKAAIAFFRASNAATTNGNMNSSDSVKTKLVSNGNKALTNGEKKSDTNSVNSSTVPSDPNVENTNVDNGSIAVDTENHKIVNQSCPFENGLPVQTERPKKKLKLEEYLNRRNLKEREKEKTSNVGGNSEPVKTNDWEKSLSSTNSVETKEKETVNENEQEKVIEEQKDNLIRSETKRKSLEKKYWRGRSHRSSSVSSVERDRRERRRRSRSKSPRYRRSSSNSSGCKRREGRGKYRYRRSESRDRKKSRVRSGSLSRSSSRESSTSSDHSGNKYSRNSSSRYRRRTRSRSVSRGRSRSRNRGYKRRRQGNYYCNRNFNSRRSKSPFYPYPMSEKQRQIEERRVIYVGRIEEGMTNAKLRERFSIFGPIIDISLHFREYGDNYGFVTYAYKADAYDAVEHGNDDPSLPRYDLCFGGRRGFCKEKYADLDGMPTSYSGFRDNAFIRNTKDSFDLLLKEAQAKLKNRKKQ